MRKDKILEIENAAEKVLKKMKVNDAPVPLEEILSYHQITLLDAPSDTYSGMMLTTGKKTFIGLNTNEQGPRRRFTIAHELGHYFLENAEERAFVDESATIESGMKFEVAFRNKSHKKGDYEEMRANAFAASLLMPAKWLIRDLKNLRKDQLFSGKSIKDLASKYQVSEEAMRYRVMNVLNDFLVETI